MERDTCGAAYRRSIGAVAALAAVAVLAAGCGGSTSKTATSATTAATSATSGSAAGGSNSATTGAASATTTPGAETTVTVAAVKTGSLGSSFCSASKELKKREAAENKSLADTPQALEKLEKQAAAELPEFQRLAPSSLKSAVQVLVAADRLIFNQLQAVNFNFAKLPPNADQAFSSPKFTQAEDQVTSYLTHVCGISPNT